MVFAVGFTFLVWDLMLKPARELVLDHVGRLRIHLGYPDLPVRDGATDAVAEADPLKDHLHHIQCMMWQPGWSRWSCFCAYIAFSQYMLIYYANLDEETFFYVIRTQHGYGWYMIIECHSALAAAFPGSDESTRAYQPEGLAIIAIWCCVGNWIDWSWIIMPAFSQNSLRFFFDIPELLIGIGFAGGMLFMALMFWKRHGLLLKGDPDLFKSINAEHLH